MQKSLRWLVQESYASHQLAPCVRQLTYSVCAQLPSTFQNNRPKIVCKSFRQLYVPLTRWPREVKSGGLGIVRLFWLSRDLLDEAKDYHLMPERRSLLQTFKTRPRCCTDVVGVIYAVGGLTSSGKILIQSGSIPLLVCFYPVRGLTSWGKFCMQLATLPFPLSLLHQGHSGKSHFQMCINL